MASAYRRCLPTLVGVVLALLLLQLFPFQTWLPVQAAPTTSTGIFSKSCRPNACQGTFYGARNDWMQQVMQRQQYDYYCGVVNILAMDLYDFKKYGQNPTYSNQNAIAGLLNNQYIDAISPWGYGGGKFDADISGDTGTDPRAIAFGTYTATPPYYYYHNYIYNTSSDYATHQFAPDFGANSTQQPNIPISVTINQGEHSFIVDGVYAASDPSYGGGTIYGISTWDPWLNSSDQAFNGNKYYNQTQNEVWSLSDWEGGTINPNGPFGGPVYLWAKTYSHSANGGYDPDPSTPINYYNHPVPTASTYHWTGYWITIEWDEVTAYTEDIALGANFQPVPHN